MAYCNILCTNVLRTHWRLLCGVYNGASTHIHVGPVWSAHSRPEFRFQTFAYKIFIGSNHGDTSCIDHDDTHLHIPFLSAPWWSTGFLYHPYHRCNQAWTWIGRGLVTDSSTIHRMLRTINVDVHHNNSRGIVYRSMASALDCHQHHLISCGTNSYRWRCSLVPIYTSMCHRTYV